MISKVRRKLFCLWTGKRIAAMSNCSVDQPATKRQSRSSNHSLVAHFGALDDSASFRPFPLLNVSTTQLLNVPLRSSASSEASQRSMCQGPERKCRKIRNNKTPPPRRRWRSGRNRDWRRTKSMRPPFRRWQRMPRPW